MKNRLLRLLIVVLFSCSTASAQSWLWGQQGSTAIKADFYANNVATYKTGDLYQVGSFNVSIKFGTYTLTSSDVDIYLIKYDQNGNILWVKQSVSIGPKDSTKDARPALGYSVATDDSGNSYITGAIGGTTIFGNDTLAGIGNYQVFLAKYDPNGNVMWAKGITINNSVADIGWAVATDHFGHEYITGNSAFLYKFDRNGNMIWTVTPTSTSSYDNNLYGYSIAPDISGNIYVSGEFEDSLIFGTYKLYSPGSAVYVVKFDSNGNVLWTQQSTHSFYSGTFGRGGYTIAADRSGAAYLTGSFSDSIAFDSYIFTTRKDIDNNFFVVKYNPGGSVAWAKDAIPINNASLGSYSVCTDDSAHIYICGGIEIGPAVSFIFANDTISVANNAFDNPSFLLKLDSSGYVICGSTLEGGGTEPNAVTADSTGKFVYLGGGFLSSLVLGSDNLTDNTGGVDAFVARWQSCLGCNLVVNVSQSPSICEGQSVPLTASGGENYTWSPTNGLSVATGDSVVATPSLTTTYSISATLGSCSDSAQIIVIVNPMPIVTVIPPNASVCTGQSILLIVSGATTYIWSPVQLLNSSTGDTVVATPSIQTTYTVVGTNSNGCSASDTDVVSIIPGLNTPTITQQGDTLFSSATQGNQWVLNDTLIPGATNVFYVITKPGWYKVLAINPSNGCSTASDSSYYTPTGINQLSISSNQLSIYPNPTGGEIFINISSSVGEVKDWYLQITDVLGRTVYFKQSLNYSNDIDLSNLSSGVYFIIVINKSARTVVPMVKDAP